MISDKVPVVGCRISGQEEYIYGTLNSVPTNSCPGVGIRFDFSMRRL